MPYSAEISRSNPTCFLFLIDQSKSMLGPLAGAGSSSKAAAVASSVNHLLYSLVLRCVWGSSVMDRFHVGVIGYGAQVGPALGGALAGRELVPIGEVARSPLRVEQEAQTNLDGTTQTVRKPIWFEPTGGGQTPMCAAFRLAASWMAGFLLEHPDCFPPVVINITDGKPNDGNPEAHAVRLQQLSSTDGNVLLFNVLLSSTAGERIEFPDSEATLPDAYSRLLFRMSSPLPEAMWSAAQEAGVYASSYTRGCVFNADLDSVVRALDIGTRVSMGNRR